MNQQHLWPLHPSTSRAGISPSSALAVAWDTCSFVSAPLTKTRQGLGPAGKCGISWWIPMKVPWKSLKILWTSHEIPVLCWDECHEIPILVHSIPFNPKILDDQTQFSDHHIESTFFPVEGFQFLILKQWKPNLCLLKSKLSLVKTCEIHPQDAPADLLR